jgi:hypothetical protein
VICISVNKIHDISGIQRENLDCSIRSLILENKVPENKGFSFFLFSSVDIERCNTICKKKLHISVEFCGDKMVHIFREMEKEGYEFLCSISRTEKFEYIIILV